jgi:hypothetical protein
MVLTAVLFAYNFTAHHLPSTNAVTRASPSYRINTRFAERGLSRRCGRSALSEEMGTDRTLNLGAGALALLSTSLSVPHAYFKLT